MGFFDAREPIARGFEILGRRVVLPLVAKRVRAWRYDDGGYAVAVAMFSVNGLSPRSRYPQPLGSAGQRRRGLLNSGSKHRSDGRRGHSISCIMSSSCP